MIIVSQLLNFVKKKSKSLFPTPQGADQSPPLGTTKACRNQQVNYPLKAKQYPLHVKQCPCADVNSRFKRNAELTHLTLYINNYSEI
jgi:hypothetical protein